MQGGCRRIAPGAATQNPTLAAAAGLPAAPRSPANSCAPASLACILFLQAGSVAGIAGLTFLSFTAVSYLEVSWCQELQPLLCSTSYKNGTACRPIFHLRLYLHRLHPLHPPPHITAASPQLALPALL